MKHLPCLVLAAYVGGSGVLPALSETIDRAAPAATWPMAQYFPDHNAVFDHPNWSVSWRADITKRSNGGISIVGSTLYIDSFDHKVYAFDALTGHSIWQQTLPNVLMNAPIVVSGIVIVGTGTAHILVDSPTLWIAGEPEGDAIYGLDAKTGVIVWQFDTVGEDMPTGAAVLVNHRDEFVFTNGDNHVYGLDVATGRLLWKQNTLGVDGMAPMTVVDGIVYGTSTMGGSGYFEALATNRAASAFWSRSWALDPAHGGQFI